MKLVPVILVGGSGTRLWPVSRKNHPKQFLNITGDQTLLQATLSRLDGLENIGKSIVLCNESHRFTAAEQLHEMAHDFGDLILEPVGKNTAPAVAIAALQATQNDQDALLLVLPADHVIQDNKAFHQAIELAVKAAKNNKLVTFGIVPHKPETGYGYVKRGEAQTYAEDTLYNVAEFVEKPNLATAEKYVNSGDYYWNSGMFLFKASVFLHELEQFNPEMLDACRHSLSDAKHDLDFLRLEKEAFKACPSDSIDYAVMEKTDKAVVVPLDAAWNDVGSWDALWEIEEKQENGNVLRGDVIIHQSHDCLVRAEHKLVSLVGVKDLVIIETKDALLVAAKDKVQDVKAIVEELRSSERSESELHREVYRPWGKYDSVDVGEHFQVKRITVKPGQSTSMQKHHHRAEHWIIVSGTAKITCDDKTFLCTENKSAFIPQGSKHRIANPGKILMEMIEVQTGNYLGEDDIVRYEDNYGRRSDD
ncbi:MAG: mannose-1-phosphate guanylyltransferase/mannose-6-phosphate isomerase [Cocleimonas sp.]